MYLDWVLACLAIFIIVLLVYAIYHLYSIPEGFALVQTPNQTYTIPIIEGVSGRYVRIRPSLTGDGYLTISQIQVIDINGQNIAIKKKVTATSEGGSDVDKMFGRILNVNGFNEFRNGVSDDPSCVVDGVIEPRNTLENVFETGVQNTVQNDTQYLEIDLSGNNIISSIVYTGRGDAETRTVYDVNSVPYYLTQVDRVKGMRVEIRDTQNRLVFGGPGVQAAMFPTTEVNKQKIKITNQAFTVNSNLATAQQKDTIQIPNVASYKAIAEVFRTATPLVAAAVSTAVRPDYVPDINPVANNKELIKSVYTKKYAGITIDLSNNIFPGVVSDYPISFYNDFYVPACSGVSPVPNFCRTVPSASSLSVSIFGTASQTAKDEMAQSINLCKKLYLGSQAAVENYIRIKYDATGDWRKYKVYLRGTCTGQADIEAPLLGTSDLIVVFEGGDFVTKLSAANQTSNTSALKCDITTGASTTSGTSGSISAPILALIPLGSRKFLIEWIYNRMQRYTEFAKNDSMKQLDANLELVSQYRCTLGTLTNCETGKQECAVYYSSLTDANAKHNAFVKNQGGTATRWSEYYDGYGRKKRYRYDYTCTDPHTKFTDAKAFLDTWQSLVAGTAAAGSVQRLSVPIYIDVRSTMLMDSIAQQFYEFLDGNFAMTYIYDAFPLGSTMLDMRFQLYVHDDVETSYAPINDLKAQYTNIISATTQTQGVLDEAEYDYQSKLFDLENDAINSTLKPFEGAVVRLFYEKTTTGVNITGLIFDAKAVTSFIPELNGGIPVPIGPEPGNINYQPNLVYTKNRTEPLDCTKSDTLKRVMHDYVNLMKDPKNGYPLSKASPAIHVTQGDLVVTQIIGSQQISDTQCAVTWKESLYDPNVNAPKNVPLSTGSNASGSTPSVTEVTRSGLISYTKDTSTWFASQLTIDISGFKLFSEATVPECKFNPQYYRSLYPNRYSSSATLATLAKDFITNDFGNGQNPICPDAIPRYVYNVADAGNVSLQAYMQTNIYNNYTVRPAKPITPFARPILITKPIPNQATLDNLSNLCPAASCEDMDVLYSLVDQYNSDATLPGTILSVTHAFTPNTNQCDVRVSMNYGGTVDIPSKESVIDPATGLYNLKPSYEKVVKGTVTYTSGSKTGEWTRGSKAVPYYGVYGDTDKPVYSCPAGYTVSGTTCTKPPVPPQSVPATITSSCPPGAYYDKVYMNCSYNRLSYFAPSVTITCPTGYTLAADRTNCLQCPTGYTLSGTICNSNPVNATAFPSITLAMYVKLDPLTCSYTLVDASGQNSGYSIQANTPKLFTPMIYSNELIKRNIGKLDSTGSLTLSGPAGSAINAIQTDFIKAQGSTKQIMKSYRMQTYNIAGGINTLTSCPNSPACNTSSIQNMIKDYFKTNVVTTGEQIDTILRTSSIDGKSCDATFTTTSARTLTNRFLFSPTCTINGHIGTNDLIGNLATGANSQPITDEQILDIRKELSTTIQEAFIPYKNPSVSAFTNYSAAPTVLSEALDVRSFGQDSGRNGDYSIRDAQFETPLIQKLPPKKRIAKPAAYKFLRFTPLETRSPNAASVNVGKFIFFYDSYPLFLKGTVTNPMGTWEGKMTDVIGPDIRPGWSDAHKKSLTFAFSSPVAVDAYSFTTALPEMGIAGDPVSWKLEGSTNGTFWTILDTQKKFSTPITRFADLDKIYITAV